jgi:hypothetical protein
MPVIAVNRENSVPADSFLVIEHTLPAISTNTVVPHGLSKHPKQVTVELKCLSDDLGYSAGDRIIYNGAAVQVAFDASNITLVLGNALPSVISKTSNAAATISVPARWSLLLKAESA